MAAGRWGTGGYLDEPHLGQGTVSTLRTRASRRARVRDRVALLAVIFTKRESSRAVVAICEETVFVCEILP